ncbi:MAG: hypothetical protein AAFX56_18285 [Pseudomonadota bacterium]
MSAADIRLSAGANNWIKRLGWAGFLFFAVKGLLWLAAPLVFYWLT